MTSYRKSHITRHRNGWRYKRRVPDWAVTAVGRAYWTKYLGAVSQPDALIAARKRDVAHDELLARLKTMTPDERLKLGRSGGIKALEAKLEAGEIASKFIGATGVHIDASDVNLDDDDAIEQLKAIKTSRSRAAALKRGIAARRKILEKVKGAASESALEPLIQHWVRVAAPRQQKTVSRMRTYVARFVESAGDLAPADCTRAHVIAFRDHLEAKGETRSNVAQHLSSLHRLFAIGVSENVVASNPVTGVKAGKSSRFSDDDGKQAFTGVQVKTILDASAQLTGRYARDAAWIIRLLAYHGARSGEIVQLRARDVTVSAGVPILRITDEVGSLKNRFSKRDIPIHAQCLDIVNHAQSLQPDDWLFSSFADSPDRALGFQRFASRFIRKNVGISDPGLTMHSLRHTWRTAAREIDMPLPVSMVIMGHSMGGGVHDRYGAAPSMREREKWMRKIDPTKL
ncbi:MAG: tyrosine-type recombinase/integrase [Hyphomicrobiaceae bacterium]